MSLGAKSNVSEKQELKNKLFDKIHNVVYSELNKMGCKYVEHGESSIIGTTEFKGLKIRINVEIK